MTGTQQLLLRETASRGGDAKGPATTAQDAPPRRTSLTAASASSPAAHKRQAEPVHAQPAKRPAAGQQQLAVANQREAPPPLFLPSLTLAQLADVLHASYGYSSATSSWMLAPLRSLARQLHGKATDKNVQVSKLLPHVPVLLEQWSHPSIAPATALGYCSQVVKLLALPEVSRLLSQPALQQLTQELARARDRFDAANQAADSRAHANRPIKAASTPMPAAAAAAAAVAPLAMGFRLAAAPAAAPAVAADGDMLGRLATLLQQAPTGVPASLLPQLRMLATQLLGPTYDISPESHVASRLPGPGAGIGAARGHLLGDASSTDAGSQAAAAAAVATDSEDGTSPDEATLEQQDSEDEAAATLLELADAAAAVATAAPAGAACETIEGLTARLMAGYHFTPQTVYSLLTVFRQAAQLQGSHRIGSFGGLALRPLVPQLHALPQLWLQRVQAADLRAITACGYANRLHTLLNLPEAAELFDSPARLQQLRESVAQARACFTNNGGAS